MPCKPFYIDALADSSLVCITKADNLGAAGATWSSSSRQPAFSSGCQTYQIAKDLVCSGEGLRCRVPFTAVSAGPELFQIQSSNRPFGSTCTPVYRIDGPLTAWQKSFVQC